MGCVYQFTAPSGKIYIGQTQKTLHQRIAGHRKAAASGKAYPFSHAIRKYGIENMDCEILFESSDKEMLCLVEIEFIAKFKKEGFSLYNATPGGESFPGYLREHPNTRRAAEANTARLIELWKDPEYRATRTAASKEFWSDPKRKQAELDRRRENMTNEFRIKISNIVTGDGNPNAKINSSQVLEIVSLAEFKTAKELAEQFGITKTMVHAILSGKSWKSVTGIDVPIKPFRKVKVKKILSDEEIEFRRLRRNAASRVKVPLTKEQLLAAWKEGRDKYWADPENRKYQTAKRKANWDRKEFRDKMSAIRKACVTPEMRARISECSKARWADEEYRAKAIESFQGETNPNAVLTEKQVLDIYNRLLNGEKGVTLAREYGATNATITSIKYGRQWGSVTGANRSKQEGRCQLDAEKVMRIMQLRKETGLSAPKLAAMLEHEFPVKAHNIDQILCGKNWSHLTGINRKS